jgi:hypothetical protein
MWPAKLLDFTVSRKSRIYKFKGKYFFSVRDKCQFAVRSGNSGLL